MERGTFIAPCCEPDQRSVTLSPSQLALLLDGLEVITTRRSVRYLNRTRDAPPGNMVLWRGMTRLTDIHLGFTLAKDVGN